MNKIILTDNIAADARDKGICIADALQEAYADDIQEKIKNNAAMAALSPLQMVMVDANLTKKSRIKDFYTSGNNELLFPAIIDTKLAETVGEDPYLSMIIGSEQGIDGVSVKALTLDLTSDENKAALRKKDVVEGSDLPVVKIKTADKAISLYKRGVAVETTYEAIRHTTLDMFLKTIQVIGANSANQQFGDAINVLIDGDGNANPASVDATATTTLTNDDIIDFALNFYDANGGLILDTIICDKTLYKTLVKMVTAITNSNEYKLGAGFKFPQSMFEDLTVIYDKRVPLIGGKSQLIGLNKDNALTKYFETGSIINEVAANIRNQTQLGTLSETVGFAKFINSASRVLKLK